jgi:rhamnose utilization protein RhaD (predicted bifunctional aldolase and dehydrogenase)
MPFLLCATGLTSRLPPKVTGRRAVVRVMPGLRLLKAKEVSTPIQCEGLILHKHGSSRWRQRGEATPTIDLVSLASDTEECSGAIRRQASKDTATATDIAPVLRGLSQPS